MYMATKGEYMPIDSAFKANKVWIYDRQADGYTLDDKPNKLQKAIYPTLLENIVCEHLRNLWDISIDRWLRRYTQKHISKNQRYLRGDFSSRWLRRCTQKHISENQRYLQGNFSSRWLRRYTQKHISENQRGLREISIARGLHRTQFAQMVEKTEALKCPSKPQTELKEVH